MKEKVIILAILRSIFDENLRKQQLFSLQGKCYVLKTLLK
jgi:hypothetical protein